MSATKQKKKFELPHVYTIAFMLIILFAVLTWIVPSGQFERQTISTAAGERDVAVAGTYAEVPKVDEDGNDLRQGLDAVLMAPTRGIQAAGDVVAFVLLIGGTFAPILLVYLGGAAGVAIFCVQWAVILTGVTLVMVFGPGRWRALHFTLYFLIGWSGLVFLPRMYLYSRTLLWFIFAGGLAYTLGMIPFAGKRKYDHCVWHIFVLAGAALHWVGIYTQIYALR